MNGVTQLRVMKSEWIKFRSLRSTVYTLLISLVLMIGLGLLFCLGEKHRIMQGDMMHGDQLDAAQVSLRGLFLAQLSIGVLGVLMFSGEYATGMIRATFGAVPKRLPVLWAKLTVYGITAFVFMTLAAFIAFAGGQAILSGVHVGTSLSAPHVVRQILGAGVFLFGIGLLGVSFGALLRSTAGAVTALFGLLFVVPVLADFLPTGWDRFNKYLPSSAGETLISLHHGTSLSPAGGLFAFVIWIAIAIAAAAVVLKTRDA